MNRYERLCREYSENRYLENLPLADLQKRIIDIFVNILRFDERGMVVPYKIEEGGAYWWDVFEHARHEIFLRFGPYPAGFDSGFLKAANIPKPDLPRAKQAVTLLASKKLKSERTFFKFGDAEHLSDLLRRGILRISPASAYSDPSLNPAIQDNELKLALYPSKKPMPLQGYEPPQLNIPGTGIVSIEAKSPTNYYVFCVSAVYNPRLAVDFDKGAVLEIRDPFGFSKRLVEATKSALPSWMPGLSTVSYIDPLLPRIKMPNTFFCKHFRYAYQGEVRYVWLPPAPIIDLEPIEVEMGNLEQFCELHILSHY